MTNCYRFGGVEVRPVERQLLIEGRSVSLGARAFDVLMALIDNRHRVVTKNELLERVWPGLVVEENNLQAQVSALRKLIGAKALATIPGYGYRFAAALQDDASAPSVAPMSVPGGAATELIGRDCDLPAVSELVLAHRLVTILGAGGIGKTRLARSVAGELATRFAHGVRWVDLASIASADKIAPAIAGAAAVTLGDGEAVTLLARALAGREMLLVLDNCEHLSLDVARAARTVLAAAPAIRILATSQEVLQVAGERVYRLEGLAVPPAGTPLAAARTFGAVQLLEARAQAADRRFALGEDTIAGAIEICRHLDGIALAIEMVAARLPLLGIDALNSRLDERLRMLRSSEREAPARQQTLRATLDWSHSLLNDPQPAVLRRLSVFAGSFRLDMAERVARGEELDEWSVLDALVALADKSMLQVVPGHSPRYRLLESTRLYALERLAEHGEVDAVQRRHGEAMVELGNEIGHGYLSLRESPSLEDYSPDYDDLQAAFDRATARADAEVAAFTGRSLTFLDFERNMYGNVRKRKEAAAALLATAQPLARGMLLNILSHFRLILLPSRTRMSVALERVAAWRGLGIPLQLYLALARLGADHAVDGDFRASEQALDEARALENPAWTPHVRWFYAYARRSASVYGGDPDTYVRWSRVVLEVALETKSPGRIAEARVFCAAAVLMAGDVDEAIRLSRASIQELRALGHPINLIDALTNLCTAQARAGELDSARATALEAIRLPWQQESAMALFDQAGLLAARLGRHAQAARTLGFADRGYAMAQDRRHTLAALAENEARTRIVEAAGATEHSRLRTIGADMKGEAAEALVREMLEGA